MTFWIKFCHHERLYAGIPRLDGRHSPSSSDHLGSSSPYSILWLSGNHPSYEQVGIEGREVLDVVLLHGHEFVRDFLIGIPSKDAVLGMYIGSDNYTPTRTYFCKKE